MKILLAVDASECSEAAVQAVRTRYRSTGTQVRVLHAVEWMKDLPISFAFGQGGSYAQDLMTRRTECFQKAEQLVTRVADTLRSAGFDASVSTPEADPRHAILDAAREWGAQLIVLGSHGRRGLDRLVMGSVAEAVVRRSPCSVSIERPPLTSHAGSKGKLQAEAVPS